MVTAAASSSSGTVRNAARSAYRRLSTIPLKYPFAFGVVLSGTKTSFSDVLVQKVVERKERIDWRRNGAFACFGFVYLGAVQYSLYVSLFGRIFPAAAGFAMKPIRDKIKDLRGMWQLCAQVFLDQCVHHPIMYFPAFYVTKELVMNPKPDIRRALLDYKRNMKEDLLALWKIWVPAMFLNFSLMSMHLRIPFVAGVSLLWTCILSTMRGGDIFHGEDMAGGAVTGATLTYVKEGIGALFTQPLELDRDKSHMMITASGHDKPGWVAILSRTVANKGGNVTHSKMVRLGRDFIIQMHVSVDPQHHRSLVNALTKNATLKPLQVKCSTITRRQTGSFQSPVLKVQIRCVGVDQPGMLASISEKCLETGLSIENVTSELQRGAGGRVEFVVHCDCVSSQYMSEDDLTVMATSFGSLKETLALDIVDIRIQRLPSINNE